MGIFIILLHVHLDWHNSICYFHRRACAKSAQVNVRFWDTSDGFPFNLYKEMVCRKRPRITHHMLQHICLLYIWTKHFRLLWFIHSVRMCKSSVILYDPLLEIVWTHCDGISYTIAHYTHRYTYRVLQTIQMKLILLSAWAEPVVLGSTKTALKFK